MLKNVAWIYFDIYKVSVRTLYWLYVFIYFNYHQGANYEVITIKVIINRDRELHFEIRYLLM